MGELNKKYQDYGYYGQELESSIGFNPYDYWPFRLTFIIFGYATIVLPTYLLIVWIRRKYSGLFFPWKISSIFSLFAENNIRFERNIILKFLKLFAIGTPEASYHFLLSENKNDSDLKPTQTQQNEPSSKFKKWLFKDGSILLFYFVGIQLNFVSMGFLQERIITVGYPRRDNVLVVEPFGDAQFLVLINRIVALILCLLFFIRDYKK